MSSKANQDLMTLLNYATEFLDLELRNGDLTSEEEKEHARLIEAGDDYIKAMRYGGVIAEELLGS